MRTLFRIRALNVLFFLASAISGLALAASTSVRVLGKSPFTILGYTLAALWSIVVYLALVYLIAPKARSWGIRSCLLLAVIIGSTAAVVAMHYPVNDLVMPIWERGAGLREGRPIETRNWKSWEQSEPAVLLRATNDPTNPKAKHLWRIVAKPRVTSSVAGLHVFKLTQPEERLSKDGLAVSFKADLKGVWKTLDNLELHLALRADQRKWHTVAVEVPSGSQQLAVEVTPGPLGSSITRDHIFLAPVEFVPAPVFGFFSPLQMVKIFIWANLFWMITIFVFLCDWLMSAPAGAKSAGSELRGCFLSKRELRVFYTVLVVTLLAKAPVFSLGYSRDDYLLVNLERMGGASQGRFGSLLSGELLARLGFDHFHASFVSAFGAIAALSLLGVFVVRHWRIVRFFWPSVAVACIVANYPSTVGIFTFRSALINYILALGPFLLLLMPRRWRHGYILAGALIFAFSLSVYQIIINYAIMIVLVSCAVSLVRYFIVLSKSRRGRRLNFLGQIFSVQTKNTGLFACIVLGCVLYWIALQIGKLSGAIRGLASRTEIAGVSDLLARVQWASEQLPRVFLSRALLLPDLTVQLLCFVLVMALVGLVYKAGPTARHRMLAVPCTVLLLAGSAAWGLGINLFLKNSAGTMVPRLVAHVGIFWAGVFAIAYLCSSARTKKLLIAVSAVLCVSFLGMNNRVLIEQLRLNNRDAHKASRMIGRLETLPGFVDMNALTVVGSLRGRQRHERKSLATGSRYHPRTAFVREKHTILREISGYELKWVSTDAASEYCRGVGPWPGPESVTILDELGVICLGD